MASSHATARSPVTFAEHAIRNASADPDSMSSFMVSSPFRFWRSAAPDDPFLPARSVKPLRRAKRPPPFRWTRQRMFRPDAAAPSGAPHPAAPPESRHTSGHVLHGGRGLFLRAREVAPAPLNNAAGPETRRPLLQPSPARACK